MGIFIELILLLAVIAVVWALFSKPQSQPPGAGALHRLKAGVPQPAEKKIDDLVITPEGVLERKESLTMKRDNLLVVQRSLVQAGKVLVQIGGEHDAACYTLIERGDEFFVCHLALQGMNTLHVFKSRASAERFLREASQKKV
jgi:hypothetical protein